MSQRYVTVYAKTDHKLAKLIFRYRPRRARTESSDEVVFFAHSVQ